MITTGAALATLTFMLMQQPGFPAVETLALSKTATVSAVTTGCGVYCVAIASRRAGLDDVPFDKVEQLVDPDGDGNCNIAEMSQALASLSIDATAMQSDASRLPSGLSILHVRSRPGVAAPDHFVVAEELSNGKYRFFVPPLGAAVGDGKQVLELWNGRCVLIERQSHLPSWSFLGMALVTLVAALAIWAMRRPAR